MAKVVDYFRSSIYSSIIAYEPHVELAKTNSVERSLLEEKKEGWPSIRSENDGVSTPQ